MFRHTVLNNLQAIDNSGKGALYYSCVLFNLGAGVWFVCCKLRVAHTGWNAEKRGRIVVISIRMLGLDL